MRVLLQALSPRVEDHQPPMPPPRRFGLAATWSKVSAAALEQQVVHHALVGERETRERLRHREDDVDVADRQQFLLAAATHASRAAVRHFGQCRSRQLLYERAGCAHCSQRSRCPPSAAVRHCAMARRTRRCAPVTHAAVRLQEAIAMSAHDVGHLEGWPRHRLCSRRDAAHRVRSRRPASRPSD